MNADFEKDDIAGLVRAIARCPGPVLIAWQHKAIVRLANALLGSAERSPQRRSDECFDVLWTFEIDKAQVIFQAMPQLLLGDRTALKATARDNRENIQLSKEPT